MARSHSKDVLAVMGLLCVNEKFRTAFFAKPRDEAKSVVGKLSADELNQIDDLAGQGKLPSKFETRAEFVEAIQQCFKHVYDCYDCPDPPCPFYPDYESSEPPGRN